MSRVLNTVVELIRLEGKLELLHMNFISLYKFVSYDKTSPDARKKIRNENVQRKFCQESSNLPFAVPGNVKLKLPIAHAFRSIKNVLI
jgi:hypothetical protein